MTDIYFSISINHRKLLGRGDTMFFLMLACIIAGIICGFKGITAVVIIAALILLICDIIGYLTGQLHELLSSLFTTIGAVLILCLVFHYPFKFWTICFGFIIGEVGTILFGLFLGASTMRNNY